MPYAIQGGRQDPTLEYDVTDAATGAPMRVTILGGVVIVHNPSAIRTEGSFKAEARQQMGFFVPGMHPYSGPDPLIVPELSLSQVGVFQSDIHRTRMHGVGEVNARMAADPQRGGQPFVWVGFTAIGEDSMVLRYRVTVYRPTP